MNRIEWFSKSLILVLSIFTFIGCSLKNNQKGEYNSFDEAIASSAEVRVLNLDNQNIKSLPDTILKLKRLERLSLQYNKDLDLIDIFEKLSQLPNLKILDLSNCNIKSLPANISKLKSLKKLLIGVNDLNHLPDEISELASLEEIVFSQYPDDFRSWDEKEKLKLINQLPNTKILLRDYFGGVHGQFRLGKEVVIVNQDNLFPVE